MTNKENGSKGGHSKARCHHRYLTPVSIVPQKPGNDHELRQLAQVAQLYLRMYVHGGGTHPSEWSAAMLSGPLYPLTAVLRHGSTLQSVEDKRLVKRLRWARAGERSLCILDSLQN